MDTYRVTNKETGATYTAEGESAKDVAAKTNWPKKYRRVEKITTDASEPENDEGGS